MKIIIGVTREPEKIRHYIDDHYGQKGTLTELGPFLSRLDALNWLTYLKSRIRHCEEIIPDLQSDTEAVWYGFTYEMTETKRHDP